MSRQLRIVVFAVAGLAGILVLVAAAVMFFLDTNAYKTRVEAIASGALGMEVTIGGRLGIGFFPGLVVKLEDVHMRSQGADVASAREARVGIDLLPLLQKQVRVGKIALKHVTLTIERNRSGTFNFQNPEAQGGTLPALDLPEISFSEAKLLLADQPSGEVFEAANCSLEVHRLRLLGGNSSDLMKNLSFTAKLGCGAVRRKDLTVSDLKVSADGKNGIFNFDPVTLRMLGAQGTGSIQADFSGGVPRYSVRYSLPQFRIEEFFKTLSPRKVAEGPLDFSATLSMQGKTVHEIKQTAGGEISLRGKDLTLNGNDIDEKLSRFESSQSFNLVDLGAFFFAGPFGTVVTKGYDFGSIFQGSGGSSKIRILVSDWKVERGVARARDVAMATVKNRIALHGGLDLVKERYDDVTVALVDAKGCATAEQKMHGTFQKPVVDKPSLLRSLAEPAIRLFEKGRDLFPHGECKVFYSGSVAPPK